MSHAHVRIGDAAQLEGPARVRHATRIRHVTRMSHATHVRHVTRMSHVTHTSLTKPGAALLQGPPRA